MWTLFGLKQGLATMSWPTGSGSDTQEGVLGLPRFHPEFCQEECRACADVCLPGAIEVGTLPEGAPLRLDYGKCIGCQLCTEACPRDAFAKSQDWAFGVRSREDLVWAEVLASKPAEDLAHVIEGHFARSFHIRHVDSGSCNGCESELQALNNPLYNLHRLGVFFTASPRAADLLLVTGPVTIAMREPLLAAYEAMPKPKWVMATGTCAVSGGAVAGGYSCGHGVDEVLPVDVYLPGCPPNPAAIIQALLLLLNRAAQQVEGGRIVK